EASGGPVTGIEVGRRRQHADDRQIKRLVGEAGALEKSPSQEQREFLVAILREARTQTLLHRALRLEHMSRIGAPPRPWTATLRDPARAGNNAAGIQPLSEKQVGKRRMASGSKVIITCAVTGAIHTPSMSPHLPVTPDEIAEAAIGAAEAGAAIVHLHARDPKTGRPDQRPEAFEPILKLIKQQSACVVNLTTGGAPTMSVEERVRPAATFKPEIASLNMGSMNFGL